MVVGFTTTSAIWFPPPIKLTRYTNVTEILLKVALNTINQTNHTTSSPIIKHGHHNIAKTFSD
jgi:hypothetical protein